MRSSTAADQLESTDDLNILLHLLFDANLVTNGDLVGGYVHLLPIHDNVTMADQLPRLRVGCGKTKAHENVIQTALELGQQVLAGNAFLTDGALKIGSELVLEDSVDALHFLFFAELKPISDDLRLSIPAVLAGREISLFDAAGRLKAAFSLQEQLHCFSPAQPAYRSCVSSQSKISFSVSFN